MNFRICKTQEAIIKNGRKGENRSKDFANRQPIFRTAERRGRVFPLDAGHHLYFFNMQPSAGSRLCRSIANSYSFAERQSHPEPDWKIAWLRGMLDWRRSAP